MGVLFRWCATFSISSRIKLNIKSRILYESNKQAVMHIIFCKQVLSPNVGMILKAEDLFVCYTAEPPCDTDGGCQSHAARSVSPRRHTGPCWPLAPHFHGMPADGKYANLLSFVCGPRSKSSTGLSYCLHAEPKATGHLHGRGGAGSAFCGRSRWRAGERTLSVCRRGEKKRRADHRAVCQLIDEEQTRGEWEERWRRRERR